MEKLLDQTMRKYLKGYIKKQKQFKKVRTVDELTLSRYVRADIINIHPEHLIGMEIKSDGDNLKRLPMQVKYYDKLCHYNYIVVSDKHLSGIQNHIPEHWGIIYITPDKVEEVREAQYNPIIELRLLFNLLWRREMIELYKSQGLKNYSTLNMSKLTKRALAEIPHDVMEKHVYTCLGARTNWKDTEVMPYYKKKAPRKKKTVYTK